MAPKPAPTLRKSSPRIRLAVQGMSMGLIAGCSGAWAFSLVYGSLPQYLIYLMIAAPSITGLVCGALSKIRISPVIHIPRPSPRYPSFTASKLHLGSRLDLNSFMIRFGISLGFISKLAESQQHIPSPPPRSEQQIQSEYVNPFEIQPSTVTTISYDAQTNALTSDTVGRDQLVSAKLALLSMDHTKQIPH